MRAFIFFLLLLPGSVSAATFVEQASSFDIDTWSSAGTPTTYYGELKTFPHTFEFFVSEPQVFDFSLWLRGSEGPVSYILVKVLDRGVEEVLRHEARPGELVRVYDGSLGLRFKASEARSAALESGVYRFEVSAPDNLAKYRLEVNGGSEPGGYMASLREAWQVYGFYSVSLLAIFSPLVYVPLLIFLALYYLYRRFYSHHA